MVEESEPANSSNNTVRLLKTYSLLYWICVTYLYLYSDKPIVCECVQFVIKLYRWESCIRHLLILYAVLTTRLSRAELCIQSGSMCRLWLLCLVPYFPDQIRFSMSPDAKSVSFKSYKMMHEILKGKSEKFMSDVDLNRWFFLLSHWLDFVWYWSSSCGWVCVHWVWFIPQLGVYTYMS